MPRTLLAPWLSLIFLLSAPLLALADTGPGPYKKQNIATSRFGTAERQKLLQAAYQLRETISRTIIGQDRIAKAMQDRVVQYIENFGNRTRDPIALHMIGLPGIGKSAILDELEKVGIKVFRVDAQAFTGMNVGTAMSSLENMLAEAADLTNDKGKPAILLFDEIDKVPEVSKSGGGFEEETNPLIGALNQLLTDGRVARYSGSYKLANTLVVTAMNFSPEEIERFSEEVLGAKKSFYDFAVEDFARFDAWIRSDPAAKSKVLSHLFRSNTVSRLVPNTLIVKPLSHEDYRRIVKSNLDATIRNATTGANAGKRVGVDYTEDFVTFLERHTVYAPSGARDTVMKVNALVEQLVAYGLKKAQGEGNDSTLVLPRQLTLDWDKTSDLSVQVKVTPVIRKGTEIVTRPGFQFSVSYDTDSRSFDEPNGLALAPPPLKLAPPRAERPPTQKEILDARFPRAKGALEGLAERIDEKLIGQREMTTFVERELSAYIARPGPVRKNPPFAIIAGFPGIGKSELVNLAGEYAGLPIARINMQAFSANEAATLENFIQTLMDRIDTAKKASKNGKYILLIEELDKVFEVNPQTGAFVDRPVMNFIKDLLNDGVFTFKSKNGYSFYTQTVDARGAYSFVTMNFGVDQFGFEADPRLTSIEDVMNAWKRLKTRPADLKGTLGKLFLPETVSRMMPRTQIMKPLEQSDYRKIIMGQVANVLQNRLIDPATGKNKSLIEIELTPAYRRYLENESIIPSEGARNTVLTSQQRITIDLEDALQSIPKSSKFATKPVVVTLDFRPRTSRIVASITLSREPDAKPERIFEREVALTFPPLDAKGRISQERLLTGVHEFGHAFAGIRLGKRIIFATVVPPKAGVGGYVRFRPGRQTADSLISDIYATLASRAMERIFLSPDPTAANSVLDITSGASSDIQQASKELWSLLYEFGFDPDGGPMDRKGHLRPVGYPQYADLPSDEVAKMAQVLKRMEDYLVKDFLAAHPRQWYIDKIAEFARRGGLDEQEIYALIGYRYPGENNLPLGENYPLQEDFRGTAKENPPEFEDARAFKQGETGTTAVDNMAAARKAFEAFLKIELHGACKTSLEPKARS